MGKQMTAPEYLKGWKKNKVWTHLGWPKHQARLNWCADACVGQTFADIGCALGHSTDIMRRRHPGAWVGVDFCEPIIIEARSLFPDIPFVYARNVADLPLLDKVATAVCSEVIEHVADERALLASLLEVATRRVVITTPHVDAKDPGHVRIHNDATIARLFDGLRYTIDKDAVFYKVIVEVGG
jgi:trans-aconitate methyltransferase